MKKNKYEIDMVNGSIMDKLVSFSLPLMATSILQLMFNAVDIIVVGHFSGSDALAAVGATTALINIFTNLFIGISMGTNVLCARYYAAGHDKEMSESVHTAIALALLSGVLMAVVGFLLAGWALGLMDTPSDVIGQSTLYMKIYFLGMPFFMLYNYGAAVLRAVGDTKRPLFFLLFAGMANVVLDLLLVIVIPLGVAGVAIGTVASQMVSSVLVLRCLYQSEGSYQFRFRKLSIRGVYVKRIFQVGIPAGIQSTVINFSNALLQSSVNSFGSIAMAGYTAANNILGFLYVSVNAVTPGMHELHQPELQCKEAETGWTGYFWTVSFFPPESPLCLESEPMCSAHSFSEYIPLTREVIRCGLEIVSITTVPYFLCGIMDLFPGAMREDGILSSSDGAVCDRNGRDADPLDLRLLPAEPLPSHFLVYLVSGFLDRDHRHAGSLLPTSCGNDAGRCWECEAKIPLYPHHLRHDASGRQPRRKVFPQAGRCQDECRRWRTPAPGDIWQISFKKESPPGAARLFCSQYCKCVPLSDRWRPSRSASAAFLSGMNGSADSREKGERCGILAAEPEEEDGFL